MIEEVVMGTHMFYTQQLLIILIVLGAFVLLIHTLTKHPCGDLSAPCGLSKDIRARLKFCRHERKKWKWKLRIYAPVGAHADILMTMIVLGERNLLELEHLITTQIRCSACSGNAVGTKELDRSLRAYKSAEQIQEKCAFRFRTPW